MEAGFLLTEQLEGLVVVVSLVKDVNGVVIGAELLQQRVVVVAAGVNHTILGTGASTLMTVCTFIAPLRLPSEGVLPTHFGMS